MNTRVQDITLLNVLGKGAFGTVYLSRKDGKNTYFATKQIDRTMADKPGFQKYFKNELLILKSLKHNNIVHLEDLKIDNKYYYIVMESSNGGSLTDCLKKYKQRNNGKSFTEEIVQYLMRQIVSAIKYIHEKKIIHRDLKLDNIMVSFINDSDKNNLNMLRSTIKIIDFGFSIQLTQNNLASSVLGSPINMDPSILKELANKGKKINHLGYDQKADIWSLGTICYELLIGQSVFNAETMNELVRKVESGNYTLPTSVSSEIVSFLNGMLQYKGENRLSADELYRHPFLTKNVREFKRIDTSKVRKKINKDGLNINVKKNQTIWGIFNENVENQLLGINARNNGPAPPLQPIPEYQHPNDTKRTNSEKIQRQPVNMPTYHNYNRANTANYNYQGPTNSIYGQNMIPNQTQGMPQYPGFHQAPTYPPPIPQSQPTSYSSGMGGYNQLVDYPTFAPSPYTFASNIYHNQNSSPPPPQPMLNPGFMPHSHPPVIPPSPYGYTPMSNNDNFDSGDCLIY